MVCVTDNQPDQGRSLFFSQRATTSIVGWSAGRTCESHNSGMHNVLNYCVIFIVYMKFINVAAGHVLDSLELSGAVRNSDPGST
jgi:hypothetical protein